MADKLAPIYIPPPSPEEKAKAAQVKNVEPVIRKVSGNVAMVGAVIGVFVVLGGIIYFSTNQIYKSKLTSPENDLLLSDQNPQSVADSNIFGVQTDNANPLSPTLPPLDIKLDGSVQAARQKAGAGGLAPPGGQNPNAAMMQQAAAATQQQKPNAAKPPPAAPPTKEPTATPSPLPENTFMNKNKTFSFEHEKDWEESTSGTDDKPVTMLKSKDGSYTLTVRETPKESYSTIKDYLDSNPNNRKPQNGTTDITLGGQSGSKSKPFIFDNAGTSVKTSGAYVFSKDNAVIYSLELDTSNLDVNNTGLDDTLKKITDSFKFVEK